MQERGEPRLRKPVGISELGEGERATLHAGSEPVMENELGEITHENLH